MQRHTPTLDA